MWIFLKLTYIFCSVLIKILMGWVGRWEEGSGGRGHMYTLADSCWCMAEANMILYSNYPPIKNKNNIFLKILIKFFKILLDYNFFTVLCWFLLYNIVNQLYIYIYPLPLQSPSYPSRSSQSTELSSLCCTVALRNLWMLIFTQNIMPTSPWRGSIQTLLVKEPITKMPHLSRSLKVRMVFTRIIFLS